MSDDPDKVSDERKQIGAFGVMGSNGTKRTREQMLVECVRLCQNDSNIIRLILFGSVAKGTDTEDSDIDLCIDTTYDIHDRGLFLISAEIEKACGFACDLLIYSYLSGSIKQEVDTNGMVLYDHSVQPIMTV